MSNTSFKKSRNFPLRSHAARRQLRSRAVRWAATALKAGISAVLIWFLLKHVDFVSAGRLLGTQEGLGALALAVTVLLLQALLAALRLRWIMRLLGDECPTGRAFAIWMVGLLISQTFLTFIAGDAVRIWQLALRGHSRRTAASAILLERALGFAVLLVMVLACEPALLSRTSPGAVRVGLVMLAVLCVVGIAGFVGSAFVGRLYGYLPVRLRDRRVVAVALDVASAVRHLPRSWRLSIAIVLVSAIMHICNVLAIFAFSRAAGAGMDFLDTVSVALPATLMMLMPIALAGWGVREGTMIVGYGLFGAPATSALAASVGFGLALLITSLPGALFIRPAKLERVRGPVENEQSRSELLRD